MFNLSKTDIKITFAEKADFQTVLNINETVISKLSNKCFLNWTTEGLTQELHQSKTLILKSDHEIVSYLIYRDLIDTFEIMSLATIVNQQKRGFQKLLIEELKKKSIGFKKPIMLEVHEQNSVAIHLYETSQFNKIGFRDRYYSDGAKAFIYHFSAK